MKIFNTEDTTIGLPYDRLIDVIKKMFIEQFNIPLRHIHTLDSSDPDASLLIMPAWQDDYLGIKHVLIYPNNAQRHQKQGLYSTYNLYDNDSGEPLAVMDGNVITCRRTAAASALAADYLARKDATKLLIVGAGNVAKELPYAYAAVRDIKEVQIWNPTHSRAEAFAQQLIADGFNATAVTDLEEAVRQNDIVSCATLSTKPLILRQWVQPGTHVDLIGSFRPNMRESDSELFADTSVFVDTSEALAKSGDLLEAMKDGLFHEDQTLATLSDLCNTHHLGRQHDKEITVFKAVGSAGEDLAAAILIYENAIKSSI